MDKKTIKVVPDNKLIVEYIDTYASFCVNMNLGRRTDRLLKHWKDLDAEMLKRGILTEEDINQLHL